MGSYDFDMSAQRWEYRIAEDAPRHLGREDGDLMLDLNEYGAEGWEAVGMVGVGRDTTTIIVLLKRPVA